MPAAFCFFKAAGGDETEGMKYICVGAPCSGKSTWVWSQIKPGDLVFDFDVVHQALSGQPKHEKLNNIVPYVWEVRNAIHLKLTRDIEQPAFFITSTSSKDTLEAMAEKINAKIIYFKVDREEAHRRCDEDNRPAEEHQYIDQWFDEVDFTGEDYLSPEDVEKERKSAMLQEEQLDSRIKSLYEQAGAIAQKCKDEDRDFSIEEKTEAEKLLAEAKKLEGEKEIYKQLAGLSLGDPSDITGKGAKFKNSWGEAFLKQIAKYPTSRKDLLPVSGSALVPSLTDTVGKLADMPETILQLMPISPWGTDAFAYLREITRTQNAAHVPVGNLKPTSIYELERIEDTISTIAHLSEPIPRQWLSDAAMLNKYLSTAMREGLLLALEYDIINGSGGNGGITGMLNTAGILGQDFETDVLVTTRKAITTLEKLPITPTAWAINPEDWEDFDLLQDNVSGLYVMGAPRTVPVDRAKRQLWGLPVALTLAVPAGTAVLADWNSAVELHEREQVRIDWSEIFTTPATVEYVEMQKTGFETNQVKFRCEGRFGLAVNRPTAIVEVSLS